MIQRLKTIGLVGFLVLAAMALSPFSLTAQSFLSLHRTVVQPEAAPFVSNVTTREAEMKKKKRLLSALSVVENSVKEEQPLSDTEQLLPEENQVVKPLSEMDEDETGEVEAITLERIAELIDNGELGYAKALLEKHDPTTVDDLSDDERFIIGEQYHFLLLKTSFLLGDYAWVAEHAPAYFAMFSNGKHYYISYYYFAVSLDQLEQPLKLVYLVTEEFFDNLSIRESRNLRNLLIKDALAAEQPLSAYYYMLDSYGGVITGFDVNVSDIIEKIEEIGDIDTILEEDPAEQVKTLAELRKVQLLIRDGEYEAAQSFLNLLFISENLNSATLGELQESRSYIDVALNTDPYRIGVILPLSHKRFGILARQVLDGLELALQSRPGNRQIQLVIKDSARAPDEKKGRLSAKDRAAFVQQQVRELVEEERVIAILGPLAKNTSLAAGETAEYYKVPVISFSITEELGKEKPFLFRFQRNRIAEAENLAHYAMDYLGAKRFVLFYTVDKTGKGYRIMQAFNRIILEKGGEITGISPIQYNQVDFKDNYMAMTGGFKKKVKEEDGKKTKEEDEPIVDFDLMFAPVPLNTLKIMLDFNRSFDAERVWVLAGAEINVRENQLLSHTRRLRFIDAFPIGSTGTYLQPFYEEHWRSYNFRTDYHPPTSYTVYAYEALEIVSKLLNDPRYHNRESLRNGIQNLEGFPILTGSVRCDRNGELVKQLNILQIRSKKTVAVY